MFTQVTEDNIIILVDRFYTRVRQDKDLGPVFDEVIKGNWESHLAKMYDFWSSVMLGTGRYKGNPMIKHLEIPGITKAHFTQWLALFHMTAEELFEEKIASELRVKSSRIAESLQLGLFYRPDQIRVRSAIPEDTAG
ncbi:group III truncated hemoglobin [Kiloniella laminariae]|uniref:group III truncated hemoglobin n=1 Tax=Kiloniella laminariae TaxID=454162 RepID=UPI00037DE565|nr:group III truncated hemoglobin [Kiloniella laminariae]